MGHHGTLWDTLGHMGICEYALFPFIVLANLRREILVSATPKGRSKQENKIGLLDLADGSREGGQPLKLWLDKVECKPKRYLLLICLVDMRCAAHPSIHPSIRIPNSDAIDRESRVKAGTDRVAEGAKDANDG